MESCQVVAANLGSLEVLVKSSRYSASWLCYRAALYLLLGKVMLPPREGWALFLLWVCAHIGGFTANKVNLPPLLGMLVAGIILRNIPQGQCAVLAICMQHIPGLVLWHESVSYH